MGTLPSGFSGEQTRVFVFFPMPVLKRGAWHVVEAVNYPPLERLVTSESSQTAHLGQRVLLKFLRMCTHSDDSSVHLETGEFLRLCARVMRSHVHKAQASEPIYPLRTSASALELEPARQEGSWWPSDG